MANIEKRKRQYRDRIEITANILEIAKDGSRKTRIMYLGNLSFDLVQKYLSQLEQLNLVEVKNAPGGERMYHITPKGEHFLSDFRELQKHSEIAESKKQVLEDALGTRAKA
ncbi:MAG: winged helix-turn-helix domain-containing protein [Candidatus Bathyarchaeia archaeon]